MTTPVTIIGGGFTGLSAAYRLAANGWRPTVLEADDEIGGLAGSFRVKETYLEKFYHHWFTNDRHVVDLIGELGLTDQVVVRPSQTGMYYANDVYRLSTPFDLLKFSPLSFWSRLRLGLLTLKARNLRAWQYLEQVTAEQWLRKIGGDEVYHVVWEPLLRGKFGDMAPEISAVWIWNKLKLRGGSRGNAGREELSYYKGGFASLANQLRSRIQSLGGQVRTGESVKALRISDGRIRGVTTDKGVFEVDAVIATPALPVIADLVMPHCSADYVNRLRRIRYLANVCLVLELDRSLSGTYWLNVNDASFPFVGVIEHTNFEPPETYSGRHIVYLSKYLAEDDRLFSMDDGEYLSYCIPFLKRMFPDFRDDWMLNFHVWHARYAQPVVEKNYGSLIPKRETPIDGFFISTMAQIYPEDRGTNYAIREGIRTAEYLMRRL